MVKWRPYVIALLLLSLVLAIPYAQKIKVDFSPEALLAHEDSAFARRSHETFGRETRFLIIALHANGSDAQNNHVFTPAALNWQYKIAAALASEPRVQKIVSLATMRIPRKFAVLRRNKSDWLFATSTHDDNSAQDLRQRVSSLGKFKDTVVSSDDRCTAIVVFLRDEDDTIDKIAEVVERMQEILRDNPCPRTHEVHLSGIPFLRVSIIDQLIADQKFLIPLAGTFFGVVLLFLFPCAAAIVLPAIALGIGLTWTIACLAAMNQPINVLSNVLPIILLVIGVSNCVHLLSRFSEENLRTADRALAIGRAMTHMIPACLLTTVTTAIGFLSLLLTDSSILQNFGWQSAMGLGLVYMALMNVFGTMAVRFRPPPLPIDGQTTISAKWAVSVCRFSAKQPWWMLTAGITTAILATLTAFGSLGFGGTKVNSYLAETLLKDHPVIASMSLIEDKLGGFMPVEVHLQTDEPGLLTSADTMNRIQRVTDSLSHHSDVSRIQSYVDIFEFADGFLFGDKVMPEGKPIGNDDNTIRRLARIGEALQSQRKSSGLFRFLTEDQREGRILLHFRDIGTRRVRSIVAKLEDVLAKELPPETGVTTTLTGEMYLAAYSLDGFVMELLISLVAASLMIFFVLTVSFRSVTFGAVSVFPNVVPLLITLGYIGFRSYDLNVANVVVFAIGLGIAVDDTIHFLARFRDELAFDGQVQPAIDRTARGSGRAIVLTTILIVCGMAILLNSQFIPTRRFAELTIVTMIAALLSDLLLLPAIIKIAFRDRVSTSSHPS